MYYITLLCELGLYALLVLLFLRQILPLGGKRATEAERFVLRVTEPVVFAADCFCRMAGICPNRTGIDFRYPMGAAVIMLAVAAFQGLGGMAA